MKLKTSHLLLLKCFWHLKTEKKYYSCKKEKKVNLFAVTIHASEWTNHK